jgi:hypothetical protein
MALRQINMIPSDILVKTSLTRHLQFWGKGLTGLVVLFAFCYLAQGHWFKRQQNANDSNASMNLKLSDKIRQTTQASDKVRLQMENLRVKSGMLATLSDQEPFYGILAVLADSFNDSTWIDHFSIQRGSEKERGGSAIVVEGFSMTHHTLGLFLESLSGISRVQDVVLIYAKKHAPASAPDLSRIIRFKLSCSVLWVLSK